MNPMTPLRLTLTALAALALVPASVDAVPGGPVTNSGTKVAHAFAGCVPANCDVLLVKIDPGHPHTAWHVASHSHSSGFPPAYKMRLLLVDPTTGASSLVCPEFFSPGSPGNVQTCPVPAQSSDMILRGEVEYLRPHLVGTVTFWHGLVSF